MKTHRTFHAILGILACSAAMLYGQKPADPVSANLFPPDFILAHATEIHLSEPQQQKLRTAAAESHQRFDELQRDLHRESAAFGKLLAQPQPAQAEVLAQFDKVQNIERAMKREQLVLMLGLRAALTDEQRAQLVKLRGGQLQDMPAYIAKKDRVNAAVRRWQSEGRDIAPVAQIMQQVHPLLLAGRMAEVHALLDEALKVLEQPTAK